MGLGQFFFMQDSGPPPDPALAALGATRGSIQRISLVAYAGLWLGIGFLALHAATLLTSGSSLGGDWKLACLEFLIIGVPVLLHVWPIRRLRSAAKILNEFTATPTEVRAAAALKAQRLYWFAATLSHLAILIWIIGLGLAFSLLLNPQPVSP